MISYRWWTLSVWRCGVKLGPVSVTAWNYPKFGCRGFGAYVLNRRGVEYFVTPGRSGLRVV